MRKRWLFVIMVIAVLAALLGVPLASAQTAAPAEPGLVVVQVEANSPAARAGVKRGDILLALDKQEINTAADWSAVTDDLEAGKSIIVKVRHGDSVKTLKATVGERSGAAYLGLAVYLGNAAAPAQSDAAAAPSPTAVPAQPTAPSTEAPAQPEAPVVPSTPPALSAVSGAQVMEVVTDSPAEQAGLQAGDVITAVDDENVAGGNLADIIGSYSPGDQVTLTVARGGDEANSEAVNVTLGESPSDATRAYLGIRYANTVRSFRYAPGNGQSAPQLTPAPDETMPDFSTAQGALVRSVVEDGPAAAAGLQQGDIITALDDENIADAQALVDVVSAHKPGDKVTLTITRDGASDPLDITVTLGQRPDDNAKPYLGVSVVSAQMQFHRNGSFELPFDLPFQIPGMQNQVTPNVQS